LENILSKNKINFTIKHRVKTFEGYFEKLVRLHNSDNPVILTDLLGIRIICPFLEDIDRVKNILSLNFSILEEESKGEEHSFKEFGYDSTHLLIGIKDSSKLAELPYFKSVFEIQLRTILQEAWAEVEHELIYKASLSVLTEPIRRKMAALNASLNLSDIIFQEIRDYQKEIQKRRKKRGESLEAKILENENLKILDPLTISNEDERDTLSKSIKPKSQLEKLIFDALEAHSNCKFKEAISIYSHILKVKPSNHVRSIIYNHRGMVYFALSNYKTAINDFSKAITFNNRNISALNNRGLTYRILEEYEMAIMDFTNSLDVNRYQTETYFSRALVFHDLGDSAKALKDCEEAINMKPDFKACIKLKSIIYSKLFNKK
jgi:ppGpp synthetase/RelA/SpoT-type nucleotidyltranferase/regulator of sirC expression with transglutaminase-like and TPR domain